MSKDTQSVEKTIVRVLHAELKKAGFVPVKVWDGGEYVDTNRLRDVLDAVFSVDTSTIHFAPVSDPSKWGNLGVYVVCGNGADLLSDWHCSDPKFDEVVTSVMHRTDEIAARG